MKKMIAVCMVGFAVTGKAQTTDTLLQRNMEPVTITTYKEEPVRETSLNIIPLAIDSLTRYGNQNLTDLLAKSVPGVTQLSTGIAVTKPVIRGLYGNRIVVLLSGLKFDNQQWQEEHGLGLSDLGLSRVELVKGPMSVLYGTEAMGGIINLVEEEKPAAGHQVGDVSLKFNSNTLGGLLQAGYKRNNGKNWFRIRVGVENNGDYSDGNNHRVLNSRFDGYYVKASFGFRKKNWTSNNHYSGSFNRFGFIFNDIYTFITPDARWSRRMDKNPAHLVLLNILSSENKIALKHNDLLSVNVGLQSNQRMENEGGGAISLNMHLITFQYLLKWEKRLNEKNRIVVSHLGSYENNTNFGARKIVPDANMQEANVSLYHELTLGKLILENGIGVGERFIGTLLTPTVNTPDKDIRPFNKFSVYYNAYSGVSYTPIAALNLKVNLATGVRIPNLAELSSNGLHEGVFTYEIGDPNLKNEQSLSANLALRYVHRFVEVDVSPFYTYFVNYVYLAPTTEEWFGFPVYRYRQQNAQQYGTELAVKAKPVKQLEIGVSYAGMVSRTQDGKYTPFIPAQKISPRISYRLNLNKSRAQIDFFAGGDYCFAQHRVYPNEVKTPAYFLPNAGIASRLTRGNNAYEIGLTGNNLSNKVYYDHLSRFKNFGLYNAGINVVLFVRVTFDNIIHTKTKTK